MNASTLKTYTDHAFEFILFFLLLKSIDVHLPKNLDQEISKYEFNQIKLKQNYAAVCIFA